MDNPGKTQEWESMNFPKRHHKIVILLGSKLQLDIYLFSNFHFSRFGTSIRKDKKVNDWPGPGDTNVPTHTTDGRKTQFPKQILDPKELKKIRDNINAYDLSLIHI